MLIAGNPEHSAPPQHGSLPALPRRPPVTATSRLPVPVGGGGVWRRRRRRSKENPRSPSPFGCSGGKLLPVSASPKSGRKGLSEGNRTGKYCTFARAEEGGKLSRKPQEINVFHAELNVEAFSLYLQTLSHHHPPHSPPPQSSSSSFCLLLSLPVPLRTSFSIPLQSCYNLIETGRKALGNTYSAAQALA